MNAQQKKTVKDATKAVAPTTLKGKVAELTTPEVVLSFTRQIATFIGALMFMYGLVPDANHDGVTNDSDTQLVVGLIIIGVSITSGIWSAIKNRRHKEIIATAHEIIPEPIKAVKDVVRAKKDALTPT